VCTNSTHCDEPFKCVYAYLCRYVCKAHMGVCIYHICLCVCVRESVCVFSLYVRETESAMKSCSQVTICSSTSV
jgi:hypothetical protein